MSNGFEVSFDELDAIVRRFGNGIEDLGEAGRAAPTTAPAGLGGEVATAMVAHLLRNAATLCQGLEDAAAGVMQAREDYRSIDETAANRGNSLMGPQ